MIDCLAELEDRAALAELLRAKKSAKEFVTLQGAEAEYLGRRRKCGRHARSP